MDIIVENLSKSFNNQLVLDSFSATFKEGQFNCIMGKSGVGKSTLLSIIMGLLKEDSGQIKGLTDKKLSVVFQEDRLCDNLTAAYNIKMVILNPTANTDSVIDSYLDKIGLDSKNKKPVRTYSGGMKRRVAILRALLADFDILIMDEPLKGLDDDTKANVIALIKELTVEKTVIMTTHDASEAEAFNASIISIN